jgi:hypothetical protein
MREITPTFTGILFVATIGIIYCFYSVIYNGGFARTEVVGAMLGIIAIGAWIGRSYSRDEEEIRASRECKKYDLL